MKSERFHGDTHLWWEIRFFISGHFHSLVTTATVAAYVVRELWG
jgi:hypothetical protein